MLEYFSSTHGARKGLADTALKTADSGYLTRKLTDVAQNVVITHGRLRHARTASPRRVIYKGDKVEVSLAQADPRPRRARHDHRRRHRRGDRARERAHHRGDRASASRRWATRRSACAAPLTCEAALGVCALLLRHGPLARHGSSSVGPGGRHHRRAVDRRAGHAAHDAHVPHRRHGQPRASRSREIARQARRARVEFREPARRRRTTTGERVVLNRNGEILLLDAEGPRARPLRRSRSAPCSLVKDGEHGQGEGASLCTLGPAQRADPRRARRASSASRTSSRARRCSEEIDPGSGVRRTRDHRAQGRPAPADRHRGQERQRRSPSTRSPRRALHRGRGRRRRSRPATLLAKTPARDHGHAGHHRRSAARHRALRGAHARRTRPSSREIDGIVELGEKKRGKRTIIVKNPRPASSRPHLVPHGKHLRVHTGDHVRAGEPLVDGPLVPHDILRISGEEALQDYLLREVQNVYRSQGVTIDDKHIEIIIAQMLRKVRVEDPGDTDFLPGTVVDKFRFRARTSGSSRTHGQAGARRAAAARHHEGRRSSRDSFISAASFQETTKVLTEAALAGKRDHLVGLKENVILGHLIPAGHGLPRTTTRRSSSSTSRASTAAADEPRALAPRSRRGLPSPASRATVRSRDPALGRGGRRRVRSARPLDRSAIPRTPTCRRSTSWSARAAAQGPPQSKSPVLESLPAEARRLPAGQDADAEEAELGAAQDRARAALATARRSRPTSRARATTCRSTRSCSCAAAACATSPACATTSSAARSTPAASRTASSSRSKYGVEAAEVATDGRQVLRIDRALPEARPASTRTRAAREVHQLRDAARARRSLRAAHLSTTRSTSSRRSVAGPGARSRSSRRRVEQREADGRGAQQARRRRQLPGARRGQAATASRALAFRWLLEAAREQEGQAHARARSPTSSSPPSTSEGGAITKRENTHKMAEANKALRSLRLVRFVARARPRRASGALGPRGRCR